MAAYFSKILTALQLVCLLGAAHISQATAGYTSIYAFGDGVCTTTADPAPDPPDAYHEDRLCNGRIWIEVLAGWQGVTYSSAKNNSYFGHISSELVTNVNALAAPADAASSLFIIWCSDADFVDMTLENSPPYSLPQWDAMISQSIADHTTAVTNLYNKGARVIIMPNAVNIATVPYYSEFDETSRNFIRDRVISFNVQFEVAMANLMASKTGLRILRPDMYSFFEHVRTNSAVYGLINPGIDAVNDLYDNGISLSGAGSNYVFWDPWHPTAKFQMHLAAFIQQIVSPVKVNSISLSGGNVNLQVANIPLGRAGSIQGSANLQAPWSQDQAISEPFVSGGSTTKTYSFAASGPKRFYRAAFPVVWTWP